MNERRPRKSIKARQGDIPEPERPKTLRELGREALSGMQNLVANTRRTDPFLADQMVRAAQTMAIELARAEAAAAEAEALGQRVQAQAERQHLLAALGSASEALALLRMAVDYRHCIWRSAKPGYDGLVQVIFASMIKAAGKRRPHPRSGLDQRRVA